MYTAWRYQREFIPKLWACGIGRNAKTKEDIYNSLSVELLCDFVYAMMVEGRNEQERREFDDALDEAGDEGMSAHDKRLEYIAAMQRRGDVGGATQ